MKGITMAQHKTTSGGLIYSLPVQAAAAKLVEHYEHRMLPYERKQLNDAIQYGETSGEVTEEQASDLGKLTKKYPNEGVYKHLGWWTNSDNP